MHNQESPLAKFSKFLTPKPSINRSAKKQSEHSNCPGGRGKGGGVKLAKSLDEVKSIASGIVVIVVIVGTMFKANLERKCMNFDWNRS
ncbi:hypothetical protein N9Y89_00170 [bacterium]|nr:hypothetical protein [bacterium]